MSDHKAEGLARGRARGLPDGLAEIFAEGYVEGHLEGHGEGFIKGAGRVILLIARARDLHLPERDRQCVLTCRDADVLERWVRRAAVATTAEEIFS